jgi:hypothetical protein
MEGPEMHVARLVAITEVRNVPPDIRPFVEFKAAVEDRKLSEEEKVALLVIDTTTCYVPVFLKDPVTLKQLEKELSSQDAKLASDSRELLSEHLKP